MLCVIKNIEQIGFSKIMFVYEESIKNSGKCNYPQYSSNMQLLFAEQDFYGYLTDFLSTTGAMIYVWSVDEIFVSALRMEPYKDGYLLAGLETAISYRCSGYALNLVKEAISHFRKDSALPVYSHIKKNNAASVAIHEACGFHCISDVADYIDGTHHSDAGTWICN